MSVSRQERARKESEEISKAAPKRLDPVHKTFLYVSASVLTLGKLVYSIGFFQVQSLDQSGKECLYIPSTFDSAFNDIMSGAALIFVVSLYTAINYFERK